MKDSSQSLVPNLPHLRAVQISQLYLPLVLHHLHCPAHDGQHHGEPLLQSGRQTARLRAARDLVTAGVLLPGTERGFAVNIKDLSFRSEVRLAGLDPHGLVLRVVQILQNSPQTIPGISPSPRQELIIFIIVPVIPLIIGLLSSFVIVCPLTGETGQIVRIAEQKACKQREDDLLSGLKFAESFIAWNPYI